MSERNENLVTMIAVVIAIIVGVILQIVYKLPIIVSVVIAVLLGILVDLLFILFKVLYVNEKINKEYHTTSLSIKTELKTLNIIQFSLFIYYLTFLLTFISILFLSPASKH